jgi:hypothetical protein
MVSIRRSSRAERAASSARLRADGGYIFAGARSAVTSAAVIVRRVSMHRNISRQPATRSSRALSRASNGSTTFVQRSFSTVQSFTLHTRIRQINRCRDRREQCLQTGRRCFTSRSVLRRPDRLKPNPRCAAEGNGRNECLRSTRLTRCDSFRGMDPVLDVHGQVADPLAPSARSLFRGTEPLASADSASSEFGAA